MGRAGVIGGTNANEVAVPADYRRRVRGANRRNDFAIREMGSRRVGIFELRLVGRVADSIRVLPP